MTTFELVPLRPALAGLRDAWEALFRSGRFEPCVSYAWTTALLSHQLRGHDDLWVVLLKRGGRRVGLVPMMRNRHSVAGVSLCTIAPTCERNDTHADLLIEGHDAEGIDAFVAAVLATPGPWHEFRLARVLASQPLAERLEAAWQRRGCTFRVSAALPSFFLELPESYASYLAARGAKFRNHLKRKEKQLASSGMVRFTVCRSQEEVAPTYAALLEVETKSWKHGHGTSIAGQAHQRGFYADLCATAAASGMLHLSMLYLDDRPIAHNLGLVDRGRYFYLKTSYVEAMRPCAPATVARAALIRTLIEEGVREFDFPGEPYEWERQWTDSLRHHRKFSLYNRSARSRLLAGGQALRHWISRRKPGEWRYVDPKSHVGRAEGQGCD